MTINGTVAVQIIHFIIVYIVLDRLFWRPAMAYVLKQKAAVHDLQRAVDQDQKELEAKRAIKQHFIEDQQKALYARVTPAALAHAKQLCPQVKAHLEIPDEVIDEMTRHLIDRLERHE